MSNFQNFSGGMLEKSSLDPHTFVNSNRALLGSFLDPRLIRLSQFFVVLAVFVGHFRFLWALAVLHGCSQLFTGSRTFRVVSRV